MTSVREQDIYRRRFKDQAAFRDRMWRMLIEEYFQQFIAPESTVVEIAAGHCEFINAVKAARKIAIDINEDTREHAAPGVEVYLTLSTDLGMIAANTADAIWVSNFFEHIPREAIAATVKEGFRILKPGGRMLILQPNIRFIPRDYWMFWDHITAVDDRALCELLELSGFEIVHLLPRFLPYTTQGNLPRSLTLLSIYLKVPLLWRIFGGQAFIVAQKLPDQATTSSHSGLVSA